MTVLPIVSGNTDHTVNINTAVHVLLSCAFDIVDHSSL